MKEYCSKCKCIKNINEFGNNKSKKNGLSNYCKVCLNIISLDHGRTKKGLITRIYTQQKSSSKKRGHTPPSYTKEQLRHWLHKQQLFHDLYFEWVMSDYRKDLKPSIDRLKDKYGYSLTNIRLVTWDENNKKHYNDKKNGIDSSDARPVLQYTYNGEFIKEYHSISQASRETGASLSKICLVCQGKRDQTLGFKWKYKNDNNE